MKTFFRITALCLVMVLSLSMLVSCFGKSMDKIVDKIKDLDEDDYEYEKIGSDQREMMAEVFEEQLDIDFDGDIEALYMVSDGKHQCIVAEFEEAADAKEFAKEFKNYVEDADEDELDGADPDDFVIERSGNIVIVCDDEDLVKEIW